MSFYSKLLITETCLILLAGGLSSQILGTENPIVQTNITQTHTRTQAQQLFDEGFALFEQGTAQSYQQAISKWEAALPLWREVGDKTQEAKTLVEIGFIYDKLGFKQKALEAYNLALPLSRAVGDRAQEATNLNKIGAINIDLGKHSQALQSFQKALTIFREINDLRGIGDTLNNTGLVYRRLSKYPQALKSYQQALEVFKEISDLARQGITFNNIGLVHQYLSQYSQALGNFQQALLIFRGLGDRPSEGITLNNIALTYKSLGQYDHAISYFQAGMVLRREVRDFRGERSTLMNIGSVYTSLGQCNEALYVYQKAIAITREIGDRQSEAIILGNIGSVYECLGNYSKALEYYQQALPIIKEVGDRFREGTILNNIAALYGNLGQYSKALDYFEQALTIIKEVGDRLGEGNTLNNIGKIYDALRQSQQGIESYQRSLAIFREIGNRAGEGLASNNIGLLLEKQNQPQLAIIFYKQSVIVYETLRDDIKGLSEELQQTYTESVADTYRRLADLLLQQDRILEAQRVLDLLKVQELDDYLRGVSRNNNTEKGVPKLPPERQIEQGFENILVKAIDIGQELNQLQQLQRQDGKLTSSQEQRLAQLWEQQERIVDEFNQFIESDEVLGLIAQLKPNNSINKDDLLHDLEELIGLQDNLKKLEQNAVIIYPLILDNRIEIILTIKDSPPIRHTVQVDKQELNKTIVDFRRALQSPALDAKKTGKKLYQWLIDPLEKDLQKAEAKTIIYAPDGQLRYIPLAALYDGQQWLVERYRINHITATSLTDLNTKPSPKINLLAAAFVNGRYQFEHEGENFDFGGLPFAGIEVDRLEQTIPTTKKYVDNDFNKRIIPKIDGHTVAHFATHGAFVVGTPEQSFILFGDGTRVTLQDMKRWNFQNIDLFVLSACETGLGGNYGTGIEILGLGYRLQRAGARAVIASLWAVNDGGTQALMNAFYTALNEEKYSKAEALRQAQIALITGSDSSSNQQRGGSIEIEAITEGLPQEVVNRLSHPYYWAPFILIGNGL